MRLTIDLVRRAPQFTNTMLQREIDLRGLRISSLDEHVLVLLENSFDVMNLTSNALTTLAYFPVKEASGVGAAPTATEGGGHGVKDVRMTRVTTLIVHRNEIQRVSVASCVLALPNIQHFLADQNRLAQVRDLYCLKQWKKLEIVSLEGNPVWESNSENFNDSKLRAFLVFLCPRLKLINYQRVTQADRERAQEMKDSFKKMVSLWESGVTAGALSSSAEGGKKLRKRGREGRAAAAAAVAVAVTTAASTADEPDNGSHSPAAAVTADADKNEDAALQIRLDQLEERLLADDVTAEEMAALEEEMAELSAKITAGRKKRRH